MKPPATAWAPGHAAAFEADAAQERIGLDHAFQGAVDFVAKGGGGGGNAIVEDCLGALFGDGLGGDGWASAEDRAAGRVAEAGAGLVAGRERVAHARHQIAYRRGRDQLGVNQNQGRAVGEKLPALDDAFVRVDDRQGGAGRVGGGDCGADDGRHCQPRGDALARVEAFAAADRDQAVEGDVLRLQSGGGAFDFGVGAFALEDLDGRLDLHGAQPLSSAGRGGAARRR